ncbi:glycosyltransferase family 32 protein [Vibrio sp. FJH11]
MFDCFIRSKFFENKCFGIRKNIPYFNTRYAELNGLGKAWQDPALLERAQQALATLKEATQGHENPESDIPKIIWMYWNTPLSSAPDVVQLSIESWIKLNPDYEVRVLSDENLNQELGFDFNAVFELCFVKLTLAMKADILRLYLLSRFGGVWADSTTFCLEPLTHWLPECTRLHSFFTFRHETVASRPVEAWFIAARQQSNITRNTLNLFIEHLFKPRKLAIFVSNRRKMMEKMGYEKHHPHMLYADTVTQAEKFGFMPYFSVGYFFNESLRKYFSSDEIEQFLALPNRHVINDSDYAQFTQAVVSKQTYKDTYQQSPLYQKRKQYLSEILEKAN